MTDDSYLIIVPLDPDRDGEMPMAVGPLEATPEVLAEVQAGTPDDTLVVPMARAGFDEMMAEHIAAAGLAAEHMKLAYAEATISLADWRTR